MNIEVGIWCNGDKPRKDIDQYVADLCKLNVDCATLLVHVPCNSTSKVNKVVRRYNPNELKRDSQKIRDAGIAVSWLFWLDIDHIDLYLYDIKRLISLFIPDYIEYNVGYSWSHKGYDTSRGFADALHHKYNNLSLSKYCKPEVYVTTDPHISKEVEALLMQTHVTGLKSQCFSYYDNIYDRHKTHDKVYRPILMQDYGYSQAKKYLQSGVIRDYVSGLACFKQSHPNYYYNTEEGTRTHDKVAALRDALTSSLTWTNKVSYWGLLSTKGINEERLTARRFISSIKREFDKYKDPYPLSDFDATYRIQWLLRAFDYEIGVDKPDGIYNEHVAYSLRLVETDLNIHNTHDRCIDVLVYNKLLEKWFEENDSPPFE